ncbi:MAG: B12-binding domain-containing radical SAM protein [Candidatus Gastranaerophilales bacterium]|nr:B12-binding domain-containing radical SAM protein [Candidatus Gastranaerophilales bacterium]
MSKIFLIYPPSPIMNREDRCQQPTDDLIVIPPLPPSDLLYMASISRTAGFEPIVKDYSENNQTIEDFCKDLKEISPEYLVLNAASTTLAADLAVIEPAKEMFPEIKIIAKGAYFAIFGEKVLEDYPKLDIAIQNEAEFTLLDILKGAPLAEIKGIIYRKNEKIFKNPKRPFLDNLDEIPYPARDLIDNSKYIRPDTNEVQAVIKVSRGCPYHCFFCLATPVSGAKVRMRSPKNIIGEIQECYEKYGIKNFIFWSDLFNLDHEWVKNLCTEIINSGLKITFSTNTRADSADYDTALLMKKAGCTLVSMGIESGCQELLNKMGKNITKEQIKSAVKIFKKAGIKIYGYYVIGLPWESEESFKETMSFAKSLNTEYVSFYTATALAGTKFYDYVKENNLGEIDYSKPYYFPSVNTHYLSKERIFELHKNALKQYYARFSYIFMMLFKIHSFREFWNYFKSGMRILFRK